VPLASKNSIDARGLFERWDGGALQHLVEVNVENPAMRLNQQFEFLFGFDRASTLVELANIDTGDGAIVSCYLDVRGGETARLTFLNQKAASIRGALRGVERFNFDSAVETIRRHLIDGLREDSQGVAIFARGASGDRYLSMVQTAAPLDNRLVYCRSPEILPLIALHQREPASYLLMLYEGRFELVETGLGVDPEPLCRGQTTALDEFRTAVSGWNDRVRAQRSSPPSKDLSLNDLHWHLRRVLTDANRPLVLAGDAQSLIDAADCLPDQAVDRLVGCIEVEDADRTSLLEAARLRLGALNRAEARELAVRVAEGGLTGRSLLGYRAVIQALRQDTTDAVVIADWDHPGIGLPWEAEVEICLEALQRNKRVVFGDCAQLREAGGVGCLLREGVVPAAYIEPGRRVGLEQVA
jgi:hypothetical protein